MGFPIKVTPKMYERIRERAVSRGITLQDALVELLTEPNTAIEELRVKHTELSGGLRRLEERLQKETSTLRSQVEKLQAEVKYLRDHLKQIAEAWESWVPVWETIPQLQTSSKNLKARVQSLKKETHHHLLQIRR